MSRLATLIALAATSAALLAPTTALAGLGWHDGEAGAPETVTFNDVARDGTTVIAVGKDLETVTAEDGTTTTTVRPAIYRLAGGAWQRDPVPVAAGGLPLAGELADVAASGGTAWAVGTLAAGEPLLLKLVAGATASDPATWQRVAAPEPPAPDPDAPPPPQPPPMLGKPLSVGLSAAGGYVGDDKGQLWPLTGGAVGADPVETARAAPVNGVAVAPDGSGTAVTDGASADARIFNVTPPAPLAGPAPMVPGPDSPDQALLSVARADTVSLAVDAGSYWVFDGQSWKRAPSGLADGAVLADVSIGSSVHALAGKVGSDGYVWRRRGGTFPWASDKVATGAAINGVVATAAEDVWAVGDEGTVMHYYRAADPPPPTCTENCPPPPCVTDCNPSPGPGPSPGPEPGPTTTTSANRTIPPASAGDPTVYVIEPNRPAARPGQRKPRRLLDRVKVVRGAKRLVISFRLRAPARVAIAAKRGSAVVSRARAKALRPGRRRVVLPFTGKPPTELRIVVRPLPAKRARGGARGGNAGA